MRNGEIVRTPEGTIERYRPRPSGYMAPDDPEWDDCTIYSTRLLEIVTVAELFAAAGHPVPEGAEVWYESGWWKCSNELCRLMEWGPTKESWSPPRIGTTSPSIDLSRLPALDAWDALPSVIKVVVK